MILLTGATGTVGSALLPLLLERGEEVRVLVRDPRGLGRARVEVRIALGDLTELADPRVVRQALRGVDTVIHLAAAIRDQPHARVEELNGLATARLVRAAEAARVRRFVFFSAIGASEVQRTRFFRAKALAERLVRRAELRSTVFAPSIVYARDDPWVTLQRRLAVMPAVPISGDGQAAFEPIWAADVARCVIADLERDADDGSAPVDVGAPGAADGGRRYELAGPERLTYADIARLIARTSGRERPLVNVPLGLVRAGLLGLRRVWGDAAFATWEEAELMEVGMTAAAGTRDVEELGVSPRRMSEVLASVG